MNRYQVSMCRENVRNRAFTLIELLVVMSIITVLSAILIPVISLVQRAAKQTTCASNLRQIAIATISYMSDMQSLPTPVISTNWSVGNLEGLSGEPTGPAVLVDAGFIDNFKLIYCPSVGNQGVNKAYWNPTTWIYTYSSYCWWAGYSYTGSPLPDGIVKIINDSANLIIASDFTTDSSSTIFASNHLTGSGFGARGGNVVFNDGHVDWKQFSTMQVRQDYFMKFYY